MIDPAGSNLKFHFWGIFFLLKTWEFRKINQTARKLSSNAAHPGYFRVLRVKI